jgi:hypothetical protein
VYARADALRDFVEADLPDPLENTKAPAVSGPTAVGGALGCGTGTWSGGGTVTYSYRWLRSDFTVDDLDDLEDYWDITIGEDSEEDESDFAAHMAKLREAFVPLTPEEAHKRSFPYYEYLFTEISGAATNSYQLTGADRKHFLLCEVTAENESSVRAETSKLIGPIVRASAWPAPSRVSIVSKRCNSSECTIVVQARGFRGADIEAVTSNWQRGSTTGTIHGTSASGACNYCWNLKFNRHKGNWSFGIRSRDELDHVSPWQGLQWKIG